MNLKKYQQEANGNEWIQNWNEGTNCFQQNIIIYLWIGRAISILVQEFGFKFRSMLLVSSASHSIEKTNINNEIDELEKSH